MEGNRVTQIIGVMRIAPGNQDEVGNLVKKKLVRLKTARLELGLIHDSACGPEGGDTQKCTIHWMAVITQLWMDVN